MEKRTLLSIQYPIKRLTHVRKKEGKCGHQEPDRKLGGASCVQLGRSSYANCFGQKSCILCHSPPSPLNSAPFYAMLSHCHFILRRSAPLSHHSASFLAIANHSAPFYAIVAPSVRQYCDIYAIPRRYCTISASEQ